jgi:hypothetical protein
MKNLILTLALLFGIVVIRCSSGKINNTPPQTYICQSCSMPLEKDKDFGTNFDGTRNFDYCHICYKNGKFTEPSITMEQMIEKVALMTSQFQGIPEAQATEMARNLIPKLKRWSSR